MGKTTIEWCDHTVNPIKARDIRTGKVGHHCEKISPGCKNCYASAMQPMRFGLPEFGDPKRQVQSFLDVKALKQVLTRKAPTVYFWEDMSDLFGDWQQPKWIDACFAVMALTQHHKHLLLTKRTERMHHYLTRHNSGGQRIREAALALLEGAPLPKKSPAWPLPNVRLGASVEDQELANLRLPQLLRCPAAGHFLSVEPMLSAITIKYAACSCPNREEAFKTKTHLPDCALAPKASKGPLLAGVIVGGESGAGARPFNLQWARSVVRQCNDLGIPAFVKQIGSFPTFTPIGTKDYELNPTKPVRLKLRSRKGGNPDEWPDDLRVRQAML